MRRLWTHFPLVSNMSPAILARVARSSVAISMPMLESELQIAASFRLWRDQSVVSRQEKARPLVLTRQSQVHVETAQERRCCAQHVQGKDTKRLVTKRGQRGCVCIAAVAHLPVKV